ncbi:DUF6453 family protein [Pantoea eucalypti]|jgi:hypothetical protein|uniref:DUF6453 family protein n=1 Tax=Pantoea eucalypti TaxID=470933 RepID=UPI0024B98A4C|nr:DUF6453 family protein [Pantoea eucalypti]MDJ0473824.1 DUF6453 family protein [Pantoea eucalypti]
MADIFGVRITPDDGGKQIILDASMRYASYLGGATMTANGSAVGGFKSQPAGSRPLIVPRDLFRLSAQANPAGPSIAFVKSMSFAGNTLNYTAGWKSPETNTAPATPAGFADVFSVAYAANPAAQYGVRFMNGANFMEISDVSYAGYVTFRGIIDINGSWGIPQGIVNMGNYVVFARWSNTDVPLFLDRANNTINTYNGFGSTAGSVLGGLVSGIQIVIVSCGISPALPASGYGMVIRNAANQVVYSSRYPPVMWTDAYYDFPYYEDFGDPTGDSVRWINPTGNVALPMIPLCSLGVQRGDYTRSNNGYRFRPVLYAGFKMSGNSVSTSRAKSAGVEGAVYMQPRAIQAACQLPCIDASYYF